VGAGLFALHVLEETIFITPLSGDWDVIGFAVRSFLKDSVSRPLALIGQLQHSSSSWLSSNT
jgi:hypothetical protein